MTKDEIATLLDEAASLLGLEEVMYSLGLDADHAQTVDYVEIFDAEGRPMGTKEVPLTEDEAEARLAKEVEAHETFLVRLTEAATLLRAESVPDDDTPTAADYAEARDLNGGQL